MYDTDGLLRIVILLGIAKQKRRKKFLHHKRKQMTFSFFDPVAVAMSVSFSCDSGIEPVNVINEWLLEPVSSSPSSEGIHDDNGDPDAEEIGPGDDRNTEDVGSKCVDPSDARRGINSSPLCGNINLKK